MRYFLVLLAASAWLGIGYTDAYAKTPPAFAYYYIWFNASSWNHGKRDYPYVGRYSSDQETVMRQHIQMAQSAGINGFIVSWKSTPVLDRRLATLVGLCRQHHFHLALMYQGLDFSRDPLPAARVRRDLRRFAAWYGDESVFVPFRRPMVIWSGTWKYSTHEVASVAKDVRPHLTLLATEHNAAGYDRLAGIVDGNAYYWSSVNPATYPNYRGKLAELGAAVHRREGIWIAPAAPGFDARLVGGLTAVPRNDGDTLREEFSAALSSDPDFVGLISWNEFSESTHLEPSRRYSNTYLRILASLRGHEVPQRWSAAPQPGKAVTSFAYGLPFFLGVMISLVGFAAVLSLRRM